MKVGGSFEPESVAIEIKVEEAWARRSEADLWFLDVREPVEFDICHLSPDGLIPLGELATRWSEIPADKEIVVYCHHGMRSLSAAKYLRARGLVKARSLNGGIEEWSLRIDESVPRY